MKIFCDRNLLNTGYYILPLLKMDFYIEDKKLLNINLKCGFLHLHYDIYIYLKFKE